MPTLFTAFIAGLLSFASPCILPLVPAFLSLITAGAAQADRGRTVRQAIFFSVGFSLAFILLGATATFIGKTLLQNLRIINQFAGALMIVFGLHIMGVIQLGFLNMEKRAHVHNIKATPWMAFVAGLAFAFGWSPCIGPLLAGILSIASNQTTVLHGMLLLAAYALGISLPFIAAAYALERFMMAYQKLKKYMGLIERIAGALLIILGIILMWKGAL